MGIDMDLEFEKYCIVDKSPNTVLPSIRHRPKLEKRNKAKPISENGVYFLSHKDFKEIRFHQYRSSSCKTVPHRTKGPIDGEVVAKRGSLYRSSEELSNFKRLDDFEERRKIEFSRSFATGFSMDVVDSLCSLDEENSLKMEEHRDESSEISLGNLEFDLDSLPLKKSLSAKLELPQSPARSESPNTRFSPMRKMFDPFVKSNSQKSPIGLNRKTTLRKSLLRDFSSTSQGKDHENLPGHLNGLLKLEHKNGVPSFKFSVKILEDIFVAKAWKLENSLNWVYTFHSFGHHKRKSNASGWGSKDSKKESSLVGKMQVSCYLCTDLRNGGDFDNSMVTEFVLYDIANSRRKCDENCETNAVLDQEKVKFEQKQGSKRGNFPLEGENLNPSFQIAAIVIQLPFEKRESLKRTSDQPLPNVLDLSGPEVKRKLKPENLLSPLMVNVVTPCGNHGLPSDENCGGPSPLLDRWRLGGGCDCGGWDMACPLNVFDNLNIGSPKDYPFMENQRPIELFVQGSKDNKPALSLTFIKDGQYSIDFHAQLSALQAFSICLAILHTTEASIGLGQEMDRESLQCDSMRVFVEDDVKNLMETVEEEEKRVITKKKIEQVLPSFTLDPPFSPIARV